MWLKKFTCQKWQFQVKYLVNVLDWDIFRVIAGIIS